MCDIALAATAISGTISAVGQYQQGQVAKQVGRNNQIMAEYAAQDAQRRGELEAQQVQRQARALKGAQRATMAARGLDLGVGTQAEILDSTDFFGQSDASTARFNAQKEAWSYREQGKQSRFEGRAAARQGTLGAFGTLLGTTGQVASKWYR